MARKSLKRSPSSSLSPDPSEGSPVKSAKTAVRKVSSRAVKVKVDYGEDDDDKTSKKTATPTKSRVKARKTEETVVKAEELVEEAEGDPAHVNGELGEEDAGDAPPKKKARKSGGGAKAKAGEGDDAPVKEEKPKKIPKSKMWPPADLDPSTHASRHGHPPFTFEGAEGSDAAKPMLLGAHVSIGGGPGTALLRASKAGANGLAMFVKNQRSWKSNAYEDEAIQRFRDLMKPVKDGGMGYTADAILVHGSYLINMGNPDQAKWDVSYECFKDDLERCNQLGIKLYNWHPGSTVGACTKEESFASIAKGINRAHEEVPTVITVIENMANANSNIIGTAFSDLAAIISQVKDKSRVKVCLDTAHTFAAGYDIRTKESYEAVMKDFADTVGFEYLGGMHFNDSKVDLGACKDLHENIGLGFIGLTAFRLIMRDPRMRNIPLILETPAPDKPLEVSELAIWTKEIELLYRIQKISDEEWTEEREKQVTEEWRAVRDELMPPKEKGAPKKGKKAAPEKEAKGAKKPAAKKSKKAKDESEEEEGCESCSDD